jgi:hypothetical protein
MPTRIAVLLLIGLAAGFLWSTASRATFEDVPLDHWAYDAVKYLEEEGLVIGYPDGTFRGDRTLTRYEFAMVISRMYDQFLDMVEETGEPPIDVEAVLNMLMEEFQPELDELRELIESNTARIEELEGTVGGFDDRINEVNDRVDAMDTRFHPYGWARLRFEGIYPEDGLDTQRARYALRWGFTSEITDELTLGARFATGGEGNRQSTNQTIDDYFETDGFAIQQANLRWQPAAYPGFTMWGGKFSPPWINTPMVWDSDVQVEGLAQHYNWGDFNFYLGEMVPTVQGFYLLAQVSYDDLFVDGHKIAVTYHYINSDAWQHIRDDMMSGRLENNWDFSRLETPDDYRALEFYCEWDYELGNIPFLWQVNYLTNLEDTAPGLADEAGWQQAAWTRLTLFDKPSEEGDWNISGEWGRIQPNSVLTWLTDADRMNGDAEFWVASWVYRLMRNTDFTVTYYNIERLSDSTVNWDKIQVDVSTSF